MKKISELTELEILALSYDDVQLLIKLRKAEEGVRILPMPKSPVYFEVKEPDMTVYGCNLFKENLMFESVEELNQVIAAIEKSDSKFKVAYNYNKADSSLKFATKDIKGDYSSEKWNGITSQKVYSLALYNEVCDFVAQNKTMKGEFEKEYKEYEGILLDSKWIEDEINDAVSVVCSKYDELNHLCRMFKYDYLPLSNGAEEIAMAFMSKAYSVTDEQKTYVLENYENL